MLAGHEGKSIMLDRRHFLKAMGLSMFSLASLSNREGNANGDRTKKPNILLVLVDDMGWSDIGCYGGEVHPPTLTGSPHREFDSHNSTTPQSVARPEHVC